MPDIYHPSHNLNGSYLDLPPEGEEYTGMRPESIESYVEASEVAFVASSESTPSTSPGEQSGHTLATPSIEEGIGKQHNLAHAELLIEDATILLAEALNTDPTAIHPKTHDQLEQVTEEIVTAMSLSGGHIEVLGTEPLIDLAEATAALAQSPLSGPGEKVINAEHAITTFDVVAEHVEDPALLASIRAEQRATCDAVGYEEKAKYYGNLYGESLAEAEVQAGGPVQIARPIDYHHLSRATKRARRLHHDGSRLSGFDIMRRPVARVTHVIGKVATQSFNIVRL